MSAFEDYVASVTGLGAALLDAATGHGDLSDKTLRDQYIIARGNVAVAEALAKHAATETADKAVKLVESSAIMIGKAEQDLLDAASRQKASVVQSVKGAFQSAVDLGANAIKGVRNELVNDAKSAFWTIELQLVLGAALVAAFLWYESNQKPSTADMRRAILAGEA